MPSHQQLETTDLVKQSPFYTCCGKCTVGRRRKSRYVAMIPLSRYKDDEEKPLPLMYNVIHGYSKKVEQMTAPPKPVMMALNLPSDQVAVIDEIIASSSVFQSREHFIQVAIDWTIMSDLSEVISKLLKKT